MASQKKISKKVKFDMPDSKSSVEKNRLERQLNNQINAELVRASAANAQKIVMHMIEQENHCEILEKQLLFITPEQFDDVSLERALGEDCGYPLCHGKVENYFSKQSYIIRHNKVYDVTERKNFCSDKCYEAYTIVRAQIPVTPLYTRAFDKEVVNAKVNLPDHLSLKGKYGKPVNITGLNNGKQEKISSPLPADSVNVPSPSCKVISSDQDAIQSSNNASEPSLQQTNNICSNLSKKLENMHINEHTKNCNVLCPTPRSCNTQPTSHLNSIYEIELFLKEWVSFETLVFILGENYVRGMLEAVGEIWEDYQNTHGIYLGLEAKAKYISLCKKLDSAEWKEELESLEDSGEEGEVKLPLPNYDELKADAQRMSNIVKCFYEGKAYTDPQPSLDTILEELDAQTDTKENVRKKPKTEEDPQRIFTLPLIDQYAQNSWRRQIMEEKLKPSLATHVHELGLSESEICRLVRILVSSFDLSPQNILLSPRQWRLSSLILLKMLTIRYSAVTLAFAQEKGQEYINSALEAAGLDSLYLDRVLSYVTQIVDILHKNHRRQMEQHNKDSISTETGNSTNITLVSNALQKVELNDQPAFTNSDELD